MAGVERGGRGVPVIPPADSTSRSLLALRARTHLLPPLYTPAVVRVFLYASFGLFHRTKRQLQIESISESVSTLLVSFFTVF